MLDQLRPFRFGVAFPDILNLNDGQARHSKEKFYAGSLWKVSVRLLPTKIQSVAGL